MTSNAISPHSTQLQQLQQTTTTPVSPTAASHGVAGASSPSLDAQRSGIADQSGPGHSTLYPAYINANAMGTISSVAATPTADSVINRQSITQSGPGQTYIQAIVYDTVAMGTGSLHATPPLQSDTAAYTQVGPMAPGHSCSSIDTQLAPRHSGHITQSIHEQLGPASIEPEYTSQPSVDSQPSLSMNVHDMHARQSYVYNTIDSSHVYAYGLIPRHLIACLLIHTCPIPSQL